MKKLFFIPILLFAFGCSLDINDNPNAPISSSNDQLLSGTLLNIERLQSGSFNELGSLWSGYWGKAPDITVKSFGVATSGFEYAIAGQAPDNLYNELWEVSYTNLYNLTIMENQSQNEPAYVGIARILKGMLYMQLVNHYNNVPFSNALDSKNIHPTYDNGIDVYKGAINMITDGITIIKNLPAGAVKPIRNDILFKGDMTKWMQLGNTLRLRGLLQLSEMTGQTSYITAEITKIQTEGNGFLTTDATMNPGFAAAANQQNPFWDMYYKDYSGSETNRYKAVRPTRYLLGKYDVFHDPRKQQIYAPISSGGYAGVILGQQTADATQNSTVTSTLKGPNAGLIKQATSDAMFFSAAESYFLQAEAANRGWISGSAKALYESAVKSSFQYLGLTPAATATYLQQSTVDYNTDPSIKRIIQQKWLALNGIDGAAVWADYRRLNLPADIPGSAALNPNGSIHINRLRYPTSEVNTNGAEVSKQGSIDGISSKIFWQVH